jgi:hypothetical protein
VEGILLCAGVVAVRMGLVALVEPARSGRRGTLNTDAFGNDFALDDLSADGSYSFTISLQASRLGNDQDGCHYLIAVSAKDHAGNLGASSTIVMVPHDQGK